MPYKYIGRKTDFKGKTLWEILGNLKNFGVGRIVARSMFERYPEPSFLKILKVEALPSPKTPSIDDVRKVRVTVEKTFRGVKLPQPIVMESSTYKTDYKLIPRDEEAVYCKTQTEQAVKVLPKYAPFPPLMRELIINEMVAAGTPVTEPKLELVYANTNKTKKYRVAQDGEQPSFEMTTGVGNPISKNLYKGIKL